MPPCVSRSAGVALEASTISEEEFLTTFRYLKGQPWPPAYVCTCLEAESGDPVALDQGLGAELDRGVAASCAIPGVYPPIAIGARHYLDGGVLSPTYLDLAADHDRILFVNMVTVPPSELAAVERLLGAALLRVEPDEASWNAMGENRMDASRAFDPRSSAGSSRVGRSPRWWVTSGVEASLVDPATGILQHGRRVGSPSRPTTETVSPPFSSKGRATDERRGDRERRGVPPAGPQLVGRQQRPGARATTPWACAAR